MLEGRKEQFVSELVFQGSTEKNARAEVELSIDRLIYYAGWCDKINQVLGAVNPVSSSHFNFSVTEPTGVVGVVADESKALVGLISVIAPVIASGNTCVVLASESKPLCSITLAEVLATSDVPGGVVNILTGMRSEMIKPLTTHMDVNAMAYCGDDSEEVKLIDESAALNLKRVNKYDEDWMNPEAQDLYYINDFCEVKTTWHPIENIGGATSSY